jgi:hypothetical protein
MGILRGFRGKGRLTFSAVKTCWRREWDSNSHYRFESRNLRRLRNLQAVRHLTGESTSSDWPLGRLRTVHLFLRLLRRTAYDSVAELSGNLLKTQRFRGTICGIEEFQYLKQKLNGQLLPAVDEAAQAENQMVHKIIPLMHLLPWQDFELLVDLVFSNSGWRRTGQVGKTQKTVDIELMLPTTGERAFVQIKSSARKQDLDDYLERFKNSDAYDKMFFVWHSGDVGEIDNSNVVLIGPDRLARMVFDAGLTSWLREKVS